MTNPLLSIVIANYNYGCFLEEAIQSVISQGVGDKIELIICDAASTDNSVDIIKKYANGLPPNVSFADWNNSQLTTHNSQLITWWCSEKDGGQSAAFNKGFSHAKGKFLTWLNADDVFIPRSLSVVLENIYKHPDCEWFTGNFVRFDDEGNVIEIGWGPRFYPAFLQRKNSPIVTYGPSSFFSKKIYELVGGIDENLHYVMDNDLWLKFMAQRIVQRRINCYCYGFRMHKSSKTAEYGDHKLSENAISRIKLESKIIRDRLGYKESKVLRFLIRCMRIIDGSFFNRLWHVATFRTINKKLELGDKI